MFQLLKLGGTPESGIALATRGGTPIPNCQAPNISSASIRKFRRLLQNHNLWHERKPPCGLYNCFGHVWASRRTAIYEQTAVELIFREDRYRPLRSNESPECGDVVLYCCSGQHRSILHVGLVCELRRLISANMQVGLPIPWVLSKWDDSSGEVLHQFNDIPWKQNEVTIAFLTERV